MAQDCPLCFSKGVFAAWTHLKDSLVSLSTRSFTCPLCYGVLEGLDKFTLHLVSHEMEAKQKQAGTSQTEEVPTISIKESVTGVPSSNFDTLDELLADFSEFVKQEDKLPQLSYDHQNRLQTKAPHPLRSSPKSKGLPGLPFPTIQTPLPLPPRPCTNQNGSQNGCHENKPQCLSLQPLTVTKAETSNTNEPKGSPESPTSTASQVQCSLCGWNFDNENFLQLVWLPINISWSLAVR